jgi:hypothetical protein
MPQKEPSYHAVRRGTYSREAVDESPRTTRIEQDRLPDPPSPAEPLKPHARVGKSYIREKVSAIEHEVALHDSV